MQHAFPFPCSPAAAPASAHHPPPPGYRWDAAANYFVSPAEGLYFDGNTGAYYQPETGRWLRKVVGGAFEDWK